MPTLDARSRAILKEIIRVHVDTGRPVSSRTLFKSNRFGLSPASIRNIMADLTDGGLPRPAAHLGGPRADRPGLPRLHRRADAPAQGRRRRPRAGGLGPGSRPAATSAASSRRPRACSRSSRARSASSWRPTRCTRSCKSLRFLAVAPGQDPRASRSTSRTSSSRGCSRPTSTYTPAELDALSERLTREYGGLTLHEVRRRLLGGAGARAGRGRPDHRPGRGAGAAGAREEGRRGPPVLRRHGAPAREARVLRRLLDQADLSGFRRESRVLDLVSRYLDSPGTSVVLGSEDDRAGRPAALGRLDLLRHGRDTDGNAGSHRTGAAGVHPRHPGRRPARPGRLGPARPARGALRRRRTARE